MSSYFLQLECSETRIKDRYAAKDAMLSLSSST